MSTMRSRLTAVIFGICACAGPVAARADQAAVFAGGQTDFSNYIFAGVTVALPGSQISKGLAVRVLGDIGGYDYVSGGLGPVKATFSGAQLDGVYQFSGKNFWSELGVGVNDTYTTLTPFDPSNTLAGRQTEMRLSFDGAETGGPWRTDWAGYYGTRLDDYEALLGATHSVGPLWRLGLQVYGEGDPSYHLRQIGPYAGVSLGGRSELQFSVGEAWETGFTARTYSRALIYHAF